MARIALTCGCGWNFFIPGSTPGLEAACPSCSRPVAIPGRKPGMEVPLSAGAIAAKLQRRAAAVRLLVLLALAGAAAGAFVLWKGGRPGTPELALRPLLDRLPGAERKPALSPDPPPPIPSPSLPPDRSRDLHRRIHERLWTINLASLVSECLRYRNLAREWSQMQADVASEESKIKADLGELARTGEKLPLEARFVEGDRIVGFAEKDLTSLTRAEAAQVLHHWMRTWRAGGGLTQVHVLRDNRKHTLYLQFPEETKELLVLLRHPALQLDPLPDSDPSLAGPTPDEPVAQAVDRIAGEVIAQTEVFGDVVVEMRQRTDALRTSTVPIWPDESARGIAMIANPLRFRPQELPPKAAAELSHWWNLLSREERIGFARYFGLWCAHTRTQPAKK